MRYVQIQCNTGTHSQTFSSAIWLCNTLPVDICQLSPDSFKPTLTVSISFEHRTMSCYYHLHCNVFIQSYWAMKQPDYISQAGQSFLYHLTLIHLNLCPTYYSGVECTNLQLTQWTHCGVVCVCCDVKYKVRSRELQ